MTEEVAKLRRCLTRYLTESFVPVSITAPSRAWRALDYTNLLFSVRCSDDGLLTFRSSYFSGPPDPAFIEHPLPFMAYYLQYAPYSPGPYTLARSPDDADVWTFNSRGALPSRWLHMIADFSMPRKDGRSAFTVKNGEWEVEPFKHLVAELGAEEVKTACQKIHSLMEYTSIRLYVIKSPAYTADEWAEASGEHEMYGQFGGEAALLERKWYAGDCLCTPGTLMFFREVNRQGYESFYGAEHVYGPLAAAEGGISMYYASRSPWTRYRLEVIFGGNGRWDIRHNPYGARKDIPVEEIVLLGETLRVAGAEARFI